MKHLLILTTILLLAAVGFGVTPVYEYFSETMPIERQGTALDFNIDEVAANVVREKPMVVVSPFELVRSIAYYPLCVDVPRSVCLMGELSGTTEVAYDAIVKTTDGSSVITIADESDEPFTSDYGAAGYFTRCEVLSNGDYIASFGVSAESKLYISTDGGASWQEKLTMNGSTRDFSWSGVDGRWITIGSYHDEGSVYLSSDYGQSWETIYTLPDPPPDPARSNHVHCVIFDPTKDHTKIYVSHGDGFDNQGIIALVNNGSSWVATDTAFTKCGMQPTTAISRGNYI